MILNYAGRAHLIWINRRQFDPVLSIGFPGIFVGYSLWRGSRRIPVDISPIQP